MVDEAIWNRKIEVIKIIIQLKEINAESKKQCQIKEINAKPTESMPNQRIKCQIKQIKTEQVIKKHSKRIINNG